MGARGTDCHRGAREETHINFRFYWAKVQVIYNQQAQNKVAAKGGGGGARNWEVDSCLTFSYILASLWCEGETNPACRRLKLWIEKEKQARERVCEEGERERKWLRMGGEGGRRGDMWAETFKYLSLIHKVNHHHCSHQRDWGEGRGECVWRGVGRQWSTFILKQYIPIRYDRESHDCGTCRRAG